MILDFQNRQAHYINIQANIGWKERFRRDIYNKNKAFLDASIKEKKTKSQIDIGQKRALLKLFRFQKTVEIKACETENLQEFPHGYYSFYIPLTTSCEFPDQLTYTISYFYHLQDKDGKNNHQKDISYQQLSVAFQSVSQKCKNKTIQQKNGQFAKIWQKCLDKYTCTLDSMRKLEIYLQMLKRGPASIKKYFLQKNLKCEYDVFQVSILSCEHYFRPKSLNFNSVIQSFSMQFGEQISQSNLAKTMKMFFCTLCNTYDCGRHLGDEDVIAKYNYHYVSPNNMASPAQLAISAIKLIAHQKLILTTTAKKSEALCSGRCYLSLLSLQDYLQLKKKKAFFQFSPLIKGIINLGINCFEYDPCLIWSLLLTDKPGSKITCDLVFLYLMQEFDLHKKLYLKLRNDEYSFLLHEKISEDSNGNLYKNVKRKVQPEVGYDKKKSICHHHFINEQSIDPGCHNCICSKRGFCRFECLCSNDCPLKRGCNCKKSQCSTNKCICLRAGKECQPGICRGCFEFDCYQKCNTCKNNLIIQNDLCEVKIGNSSIPGAGLGLFAGEDIPKDKLVYTYTGDIIDTNVDSIREKLSQANVFYNFSCHNDAVDSRFLGNKARFINHGNDGYDNLYSEVKMTKGMYVIVFFAKKNIKTGEELFFNYDGQGELFKNHKHKYPFIKKSRK